MLAGAETGQAGRAASLSLALALGVGGKRVTTDKPCVLGAGVRDKVPVAVYWSQGR